MLNTLNINLKTDIKTDRPTSLPITLMSQDKNNNQFILRFTNGGEPVTLDDTYTVEILTKFKNSGASRLTSATVRQDYATWEFDTAYITQDEEVRNYVYVRKSGNLVVSADANCFVFGVDLSEIDKGAGKVAETYDENYEKVLADYSGALDELTTERLDEAVGDFNQRGDAEIADWRTSADLASEADKFVIQNLVENGDFTINELSSNFNINSSLQEFTINEGKLVLKPKTFTWNNSIRIDFPQNIGDKIYCHFTIESPIATQVDWRVGGVLRPTPYGPGESTISFVNTVSTVNNIMYLYTQDFSPSMVIKLDKVKAINLTQTFGAGNEPTKTEMDELIKITGYFDEIMLTQKQLLNWQMKLMRQNRNALIALGGTII